MARTKQTARASNPGKSPRKQPAFMLSSGCGIPGARNHIHHKNLRRIVRESVVAKLERLEAIDVELKKQKNLRDSLQKLLKTGVASDFSIKVGEEIIFVHKLILSTRSEVFAAMFGMQLSESTTNELVIVDFDVSTVRNLLKYLYTDEFDSELTMLQALDLIAIGDKYQIENLQEDCEMFMEGQSSEVFKNDDGTMDNIVDLKTHCPITPESKLSAQNVDPHYCDTTTETDVSNDDNGTNKKAAVSMENLDTTDTSSSTMRSLLPNSDHYSLFNSLGPQLYFQLVERAVREAQEKRQNELDEAEE